MYLESRPTGYKVHNSRVLAPLEEGQVLLGLWGHSRHRHIIVMMHRGLFALVVETLLAGLAAVFCIHEGLVVCTALIVCSMAHDGG